MKKILTQLPVRTSNPRENGLTMMMDKGLNFRQAEDFLESNIEHTDIIKLGFGTSIITPNVAKKIKLYQDNGMMVYAGGTLFEAFAIRKQLDDYKKYMEDIGLNMVEISDGSMHMEHDAKCEIISDFAKDFVVVLRFNLYMNFLKSSTLLGLNPLLNAMHGKSSVMDALSVVAPMPSWIDKS